MAAAIAVRFVAETPQRTRAELEHRNLDRHGPDGGSVRDGVGHDEGWPLYLDRYAGRFTEAGYCGGCGGPQRLSIESEVDRARRPHPGSERADTCRGVGGRGAGYLARYPLPLRRRTP
ncbi:hypothetical protein GA0070215_12349 [Micromonospora marina]|uniref:Uncharacterized protein n=1 Tax=Micromonospora marina TaxID=307120 RepID=A0A1C5A1X3_9ACTN|nr:hypothetical protein GA0070215_12349 [Micromonospora marina]